MIKSKHQEILNDFVAMFLLDKANGFNVNVNVIHQQKPLINLFNKILANIDKACVVQLNDTFTMNELTDRIIGLCNSRGDEYSRLGYLQNLSLLVSKFLQSNEFIEVEIKTNI